MSFECQTLYLLGAFGVVRPGFVRGSSFIVFVKKKREESVVKTAVEANLENPYTCRRCVNEQR